MAHLTESLKVRITAAEREWIRERAEQTERSEGAVVRAALRVYRERIENVAWQVTR